MSLTFANKVTVGRILIVPFFIATVMYISPQQYFRWLALALFVVAVVSDVIDGYIARTRGQKTKAGAILDPLADKILLISAFICLYIKRGAFPDIHFPLWFVVAIISRDIMLLFTFVFWYVALVATFVSGVIYIKEGIKTLNESTISSH